MQHHAAFHHGLHCLQKYSFRGFPRLALSLFYFPYLSLNCLLNPSSTANTGFSQGNLSSSRFVSLQKKKKERVWGQTRVSPIQRVNEGQQYKLVIQYFLKLAFSFPVNGVLGLSKEQVPDGGTRDSCQESAR